jgi:hypothetical protein
MKTNVSICALLAICACSSEDSVDATIDAGTTRDASMITDANMTDIDSGTVNGPTVEVGTGRDMFEPVTEGQMIAPFLGPQGTGQCMGFHIWGAARTVGLDRTVMIRYQILDADDRSVRADQMRNNLLEPTGTDAFVIYGLSPPIDDCCAVENQAVIMRIEITDQFGMSGSDEVTIMAGVCRNAAGAPICGTPMNCP